MTKPSTAAGYPAGQVELVRATCLTVATVLGDLMNDLVVIGGFVPSLLIDQATLADGIEAHVGTLDLDIGMSLAVFDDGQYQAVAERLRSSKFEPDENESGNKVPQRWRIMGQGKVTIDFLIPPSLPGDRGGKLRHLDSDLAAIIAPGLDLAFQDRQTIRIDGLTLSGEKAARDITVCGPGAYVVLKTLAFRNRGENKDAYDLYYVLRNFGTGLADVTKRFLAICPNESCDLALNILIEDFSDPSAVGPRRATAFLLGEDVLDETLQAEVAGFARSFVDLVITK